jgi:outer membrane protein OmpA-like peptidoglycan-associated protein
MNRAALALLLLAALAAAPARAQLREFSCVGAERLEGDAVVIGFPRGGDRPRAEDLPLLEPLAEAARAAPARNLCVLGFAAEGEGGGATSASRLAARRARAVALELAKLGVERDRVRAEARTRGFASGGVDRRPGARVILLPAERDPA